MRRDTLDFEPPGGSELAPKLGKGALFGVRGAPTSSPVIAVAALNISDSSKEV